jgi:stress-induced morphogen
MEEEITVEEVRRRIEQALPGARVEVATFQGDDHFEATVSATQFAGKTRVEQHQMVYAAVKDLLGGVMHALALKTRAIEADEGAGG